MTKFLILIFAIYTYAANSYAVSACLMAVAPSEQLDPQPQPINQENLDLWVQSHSSNEDLLPLAEFVAETISQKARISHQEFIDNYALVMEKYISSLRSKETHIVFVYLAASPMIKSNEWMLRLLLQHPKMSAVREKLGGIKTSFVSIEDIRFGSYQAPKNAAIALVDDALFTGMQMEGNIHIIEDSLHRNNRITVLVPYTSHRAKMKFMFHRNYRLMYSKILPTFSAALGSVDRGHRSLLKNVANKYGFDLKGLYSYFDHKVADNVSISNGLLNGSNLDPLNFNSRAFVFYPQFTPPYKYD